MARATAPAVFLCSVMLAGGVHARGIDGPARLLLKFLEFDAGGVHGCMHLPLTGPRGCSSEFGGAG